MGGAVLLDDWADAGISGSLCGRPVAGRPLRSEAGEPGHLAQDGLHRRSGGSYSLLRDLLNSRAAEGHGVLPLWSESDAVLDLRDDLHARSYTWHVRPLGARRPHLFARM